MGTLAGGGTIINLIATLNTSSYDGELQKLGAPWAKKALPQAIEKRLIILDTPLKFVEEIIAFRGFSIELELLAKQYEKHTFRALLIV